MIGIRQCIYSLGKKQRTVSEIASHLTDQQCERMREIGLDKIPTDNELMLDDMIASVFSCLEEKPERVYIAHSLPFIRTDSMTYYPCGSEYPTIYFSGLPCAIMHKTVELACRAMRNRRFQRVLVIGADKAYCDRERLFFGSAMGDGVVALLLEKGYLGDVIVQSHVSTTLIAPDGENSAPEVIARFRQSNPTLVRDGIKKCLQLAELDRVDHYVTHTSNREFWDVMAKLCKEPRSKFLDQNICNTGHMNSHDSFYHYFHWCKLGVIKPGETSLLINPGFGGTQGFTLIRHQ